MWLNIAGHPSVHPPVGLDDTLNALADPTRRAILDRLALGETRVTDLAGPFAMSLNAVSKHIRTLERASLVQRRKVGREHLLSINSAPIDAAAGWMDSQRQLWAKRLERLDEILQEEDQSTQKSVSQLNRAAATSTAGDAQADGLP